MKRSLRVVLLFFCLIIPNIYASSIVQSMPNGFTHSVFCEHFSNTQSLACVNEQATINEIEKEVGHNFHLVDFHLQDEWSTIEATDKATTYNITMVPSNVYDGGYQVEMGEPLNKESIVGCGGRIVHKIALSVDKQIDGDTIEIECAVVERNGYEFKGKAIVFIVENNLLVNSIEWDNVFRGYALDQEFELKPNAFELFYSSWEIPDNVNPENVKAVAAVYEIDEIKGSYFVQSACDEDEKLDVPEFSNAFLVLVILNLVAVLLISRNAKRYGLIRRI